MGTIIQHARYFGEVRIAVLSGAGISAESGVPTFRDDKNGLWARFDPYELSSTDGWESHPERVWAWYLWRHHLVQRVQPNDGHHALAAWERLGEVAEVSVITQNVDNLHQQAGSTRVFEIHGDHQHLQCLHCATLVAATADHYQAAEIPLCPHCASPLKPNVVLFGEPVRQLAEIHAFIAGCDLLLVAGTSAQVYPAAALPALVRAGGGRLFEFNREPALSATEHGQVEFLFLGDVGRTLPLLLRAGLAG